MRGARSWAPIVLRFVLAGAICAGALAGMLRLRAAAEAIESAGSRSSATRAASGAKGPMPLATPSTAEGASESGRQNDGSESLRGLRALVAAERLSFYSPGEINPAELASQLLSLARHTGLALRRISSEARGRDPLFSLALSGGARETVSFFSEISRSPRLWSIPYLHLAFRGQSGNLEVELKIAPALDASAAGDKAEPARVGAPSDPSVKEAGPRSAAGSEVARRAALPGRAASSGRAGGERGGPLPPEEVALLFRPSLAGPPAPAAPGPPPPMRPAPELRYVAFLSTPSGERRFVFKSLSTGKLIVLSRSRPAEGFRLAALLPDGFLLEKDGASYRVSADWGRSR